jgi:hypothetical protein
MIKFTNYSVLQNTLITLIYIYILETINFVIGIVFINHTNI